MLIRVVVAAQLLFSTTVSAATPPALTVEYAANRIVQTDQGTVQGSVVATPMAERSEMRVGDLSTVMILHKGRKQGFLLMPAQKLYQELDFTAAAQQSGAVTPEHLDLDRVGEEIISGHRAVKYKASMKDGSGGGFLWFTPSGIPVKMDWQSRSAQEQTRMTVTLDNIQIGTQDPQVFEVPAEFTRLPGGVTAAVPSNSATAPTTSTAAGIGGDVLGAAVGAATQTGSARVTGNVGRAITDPVGRSAGQAGARALLGKLSGLLRKKP